MIVYSPTSVVAAREVRATEHTGPANKPRRTINQFRTQTTKPGLVIEAFPPIRDVLTDYFSYSRNRRTHSWLTQQ